MHDHSNGHMEVCESVKLVAKWSLRGPLREEQCSLYTSFVLETKSSLLNKCNINIIILIRVYYKKKNNLGLHVMLFTTKVLKTTRQLCP